MNTDNLTAIQIIQLIGNDSVELSQDKIVEQRNWHMQVAKSWLNYNMGAKKAVYKDDF